MKRLGILLLVLATLIGVGSAPAAGYNAGWEPPSGATFNVPQPWGTNNQRFRIVRTVETAIRNAPRGSTILVATFFLDRKESVDALINACKYRQVHVRVVLDGGVDNPQANRLVTALNSDNLNQDVDKNGIPDLPGPSCTGVPAGETLPPAEADTSVLQDVDESADWGADHSYVVKCRASCRGASGGNMHDKFFAFSETGAAKNVVMVSSSNLNWGGAVKGWNDLYTMKRRPGMYAEYKKIHRELTNDAPAADAYDTYADGPFLARFFPRPGADKSTDPTMRDLNQIRCSSAYGATRVNVSMFYWSGDRGKYIANKLISLGKAGCKVSIIYGAPSKEMWLLLRAAAVKHQISLFDSRKQLDRDPEPEVRTHGKYILIKGTYEGDRTSKIVITGSQNWVYYALRTADELTLNVDSGAAYSQYISNWTQVRKHSVRVPRS